MSFLRWGFTAAVALVLAACIRPADERAERDLDVGQAEVTGLSIEVIDGQAAVRRLTDSDIQLWAQAPVLDILVRSEAPRQLRLEVRNCMPDALLSLGGASLSPVAKPRATWCHYDVDLPAGESQLKVAPPDWNEEGAYRFANMGDIQTAMDSVHEVFEEISRTPNLRFVMSTGDVTEKGDIHEYTLFQEQLAALDIPFFSTIGNHELTTHIERWHTRFGRYSVHFRFKGVDFSFLDSGNAGLDPILYDRLDAWLEEGKDRVHIFGTHYPPIDPVGVRNAGFRSRNEASMLLGRLARANVDLTLYGHIHSLYEFENAGMPAYISGGGGALPERLDGIDRHFLVVEADPAQNQVTSIEVVRVATP
jgi:hypothetical protein